MAMRLLILGAGIYGKLASEIAESMKCFDEIAFADDANHEGAPFPIVGGTADVVALSGRFSHVFVAIGNPAVRKRLSEVVKTQTESTLATILSPLAYVSPSAHLAPGVIVEPMAVVHTDCIVEEGCLVCAGTVLHHASRLGAYAQVDCHATVEAYTTVPPETKVPAGTVFPTPENR